MSSTPHDALFKAAFESPEHAGQMFRTALPETIAAVIDWTTIAPEPGSFIDPALGGHHSDLLFSVELAGESALLYLLLEHQSSNDRRMPFRMLVYLIQIWKRYAKQDDGPLPLIIPMVVSHAPGGWTSPVAFHELPSRMRRRRRRRGWTRSRRCCATLRSSAKS